MATITQELRYKFSAENSSFLRGVANTRAALNQVAGLAGELGLAMAFAGAVKGVFAYADAVNRTTDSIDTSSDTVQRWTNAARAMGVAGDAVASAMTSIATETAALEFGPGKSRALYLMGVDAQRLRGLKPEQQLREVLKALSGIKDKGKALNLARDIFGGDAPAMLRLVRNGMADLDAQLAKASEKPIVSKEDLERLRQFNVTMDQLKITIATGVAPAAAALSDTLKTAFGYADKVATKIDQIDTNKIANPETAGQKAAMAYVAANKYAVNVAAAYANTPFTQTGRDALRESDAQFRQMATLAMQSVIQLFHVTQKSHIGQSAKGN